MEISFQEAARRHWNDAEILKSKERAANADQLYGLTAECALKAVLVRLGEPTTPTGDFEDRNRWIHIDRLWPEYQTLASGRRGQRYLSPLSGFAENPFADWAVEHRYAADFATPRNAAVEAHKKAARACLVVLERAAADR